MLRRHGVEVAWANEALRDLDALRIDPDPSHHGNQAIRRGVAMSTKVERLVAEEAAASDANPEAPVPDGATLSRPNRARSTVYSIRLNPEEVAEVQTLAEAAGPPASTLVRSWIIERIRAEHGE